MDDLISRQDAVKSMTNAIWHYPNEMYAQLNSYEMAEALAKDGLMFIPSAQQWIPCSERLPESQEDVLCDDDGRVTIGYYTDEEIGWHDTHSYRIYPTAWMPLHEPYKGESNG